MEVYVVKNSVPYEGEYLKSIHKTLEGAIKETKMLADSYGGYKERNNERYEFFLSDGWGECFYVERIEVEE